MIHGAFHIVALVYIIVSGQPIVDEPVRITHRLVFQEYQACVDFMKGEEFSIQKAALADMLRANIKIPVPDDIEKPDFGIAITSSCEPDDSV